MSKPGPKTRAASARGSEQERRRWERDARYRANIAFAINQARRLVVTALVLASMMLGWPASPAGWLRHALGDTARGARPGICIGVENGAGGDVIGGARRSDAEVVEHQNGL
jgi:hypothetical protein